MVRKFYQSTSLSVFSTTDSHYIRMAIPPLAFVGWTMLQRATAFDAIFPGMAEAPRTVVALFLGVLLGLVASALAYKADQRQP
jgi:hypothetical protein